MATIKWNVADEHQHLESVEHKELYSSIADQSAVACLNLSGDMNVGIMIRTAAIMGIGNFYILGRRKYDRRTTVGTHNHIPVERFYALKSIDSDEFDIPTMLSFFSEIQKKYKVVFVEQTPSAYNYTDISILKKSGKLPPNTMFVFGNESTGLPQELLKLSSADYCMIKQYGIGRSLNVAVACGIVLAEWKKEF